MPESAAPKLGKNSSLVTMELNVPANANGVLYALSGFSGGVTCYVKNGILSYEFNLFEVQRTKVKSKTKLPTGKVKVEIESKLVDKIGGPMDITLEQMVRWWDKEQCAGSDVTYTLDQMQLLILVLIWTHRWPLIITI